MNWIEPAKAVIELHDTVFKGSPEFLDDGTEYVPDDGISRPVYVGEPRRSIDHEWALLHWGRFFLLSKEEAQAAWGSKYQQYWSPRQGGYVAALEVMHTLHCLDHIRKSLYPEHYTEDSPVHGTLHRDHCLDHLRQTIMCNADLTPIPSRFYLSLGDNYIDSDQPHTCRNWNRIRDWVSERYNGSLAVPPAPGTILTASEWS
ncbi:Cyclochlorotine biosynthesis protein R [Pseudocercospora fuligena]|uniref:Cyclochlorotine biosynthesis protein R n=2 Tax=Pseudocercospora TaxID=131324 RepID=A0A8H6RA48_9PEZI|nr:Cyclochlorotine biosynthesis protein R [Pseudocercospora fuligena]